MGRETEWHFPKTCENCERVEARIEVLETKNNNLLKVASLSSTTIEKADKRIKALEDMLREIDKDTKYVWLNVSFQIKSISVKVSKALEVKP